jgi:TolB-like protein/Flp pilus assembly protein TadD
LPLENLSGDPSQDYFADGMTEALIGGLAKIGTLRVISRTSAMAYKGVRKPLPEIARELRVDAVVEGSVLRAGDQVRIAAQLVRAATDEHLWAETYDRPIRDVLALQSEVARAIAQEIRVKLTPREAARLRDGRAVDPAAYEAYLRGRFAWNKRTEAGVHQGIAFFDQAIERDPTYALAFAGLADCYNVLGFWGGLGPKESFGRASAAATRALELDGDLAEAHCSLAYSLLFHDWEFERVEQEFLRAIELNPGYPTGHHFHAMSLTARGRGEEAVAAIRRAEELDPLSQIIMAAHGWVLYMGGRMNEAGAQFLRTIELHPDFWIPHGWLGMVRALEGKHREAIAEAERSVTLSGGTPLTEGLLGHVHGLAGDRPAAGRQLERLHALAARRYVMPYSLAMVHAAIGEVEAALDRLEEAAEERGNMLSFLAVDPAFAPLRGHPRFESLLGRIGLRA